MVLIIGPNIADMGKCEQDDLGGVRGVCQDLLIARNRCIKTQFSGSECPRRRCRGRNTVPSARAIAPVAEVAA